MSTACRETVSDHAALFPLPTNENKVALRFTSLYCDTVALDPIHTSFVGAFYVQNQKILWVDYRFCWIFEFDTDGKFIQRRLGQGKGPKEVPTGLLYGYAPDQAGGFVVLGPQTDCYRFDSAGVLIHRFLVRDYVVGENPAENGPDRPGTYTYAYDKLVTRVFDNELFLNIYSEAEGFDLFGDAKPYFREARILMGINLENGRADQLLGRFPPVYENRSDWCKPFVFTSFDIAPNGDFYVAPEVDTLIYRYDRNYRPICSFGQAGRDMDTAYMALRTPDELQIFFNQERAKGRYDWVEYVDETGVLFRSYVKGAEASTDGLQIYEGTVLVGDVDVPRGFRVKGYIAPYYYAEGPVDEENETLTLYRFTLE